MLVVSSEVSSCCRDNNKVPSASQSSIHRSCMRESLLEYYFPLLWNNISFLAFQSECEASLRHLRDFLNGIFVFFSSRVWASPPIIGVSVVVTLKSIPAPACVVVGAGIKKKKWRNNDSQHFSSVHIARERKKEIKIQFYFGLKRSFLSVFNRAAQKKKVNNSRIAPRWWKKRRVRKEHDNKKKVLCFTNLCSLSLPQKKKSALYCRAIVTEEVVGEEVNWNQVRRRVDERTKTQHTIISFRIESACESCGFAE